MKPRTGGLGQIYISCNNFAQLWEGMPYEFAECFVRQPRTSASEEFTNFPQGPAASLPTAAILRSL